MTVTSGRVGVIHVHSHLSRDAVDSFDDLREFMRRRGIAFLALTDHAEDVGAAGWPALVDACTRASDADGVILPGLEYRFDGWPGLHLLALGLAEWIDPATPEQFVAAARGRAGLTVAAHPGMAGYRLPAAVADGIDAVEVWNAGLNTRYLPDPRAIVLLRRIRATRPAVVGVAGLDQHDAGNDRRVRVVLSNPSSDPLAEIRAGRFRNVGLTMTFGSALDWSSAGLACLFVARAALDRIERVHDEVLRRRTGGDASS